MEKYISPSHRRAERLMLQEKRRHSELLFASINVSQPQGPEIEYMNICITDEASGRRILDLKIAHEDLMRAITSRESIGVLQLFTENFDLLGKEKEITYHNVKVEGYDSLFDVDGEFEEDLAKACEKYEIDGWKADIFRWKSAKKTVTYGKGFIETLVYFIRYV